MDFSSFDAGADVWAMLDMTIIGTVESYLQNRIGGPRHVFHHIPKCGGTSVRKALGQWFACVMDYRGPVDIGEKLAEYCSNRRDLEQLTPSQILCSHFELSGCHLHERYPEALDRARFRIITFVRDPLELQLSLFHYEQRRGLIPATARFENRLDTHRNFLAHCIPCTESDYKQRLGVYFFIGLIEKAQESLDRLAGLLGKPKIRLPVANRNPRSLEPLAAATVAEFRRLNTLDYLIYEECVRIYNENDA